MDAKNPSTFNILKKCEDVPVSSKEELATSINRMGRRKKAAAKRDARGYQQGESSSFRSSKQQNTDRPAEPTSRNSVLPVRITASTQERLEKLLEDLRASDEREEEPATYMPSATPSDRFYKKIGNIYDKLTELGFTYEQIKSAVGSIGFSITLESALDWLCLHLSTQELPPLFTEGHVRDEEAAISASNDPLSVIVASRGPSGGDDHSRDERFDLDDMSAVQLESARKVDAPEKDEELDESHKAWLLEQYQYVEDEGSDEAATDTADDCKREPVSEAGAEATVISADEVRLQEVKLELQEKEADLADEAANYMRSKHEIKELQKCVKQLRQQVKGLERRAQKRKAQLQVDESEGRQEEVTSDEQAEDNPGIFNMFEIDESQQCPSPKEDNVSTKEAPSAPLLHIPVDSIPSTWTGQTPKAILEEFCRREKIPKPVFQKLPLNGCLVHLELSTPVEVNQRGPLSSYPDAQQYVSTKALYQINPELPLYRLLPPFYRELWVSWTEQVHVKKKEEQQEMLEERLEKIERLVAAIPISPSGSCNMAASPDHADTEFDQCEVFETWEDGAEIGFTDIPVRGQEAKKPSQSLAGEQLRTSFVERQKSPSYKQMLLQRAKLPIHSYRMEFLDSVRNNQVSILCAETGAGKTTQCPAFLLEEAILDGKGAQTNILCTQPRRIAAISVAERVAEEMCESAGRLIGYQIKLEAKRSQETKLLFCTTGVVLRRLVDDPTLSGITHVVVDEVHERQWQIDVLLAALKSLLQGSRPDLKVILMSATLDAELFCSFFHGAPLVAVPGRTFPVATYFLEDLLEATDFIIEEGSIYAQRQWSARETTSMLITTRGSEKRRETVSLDSELNTQVSDDYPGYKLTTRRSMDRVDETKINYDLMEDILQFILISRGLGDVIQLPKGADLSNGAILIFLPGIGEIRALSERLQGSRKFGNRDEFDVIPLHSSLSSVEQRRAFQSPGKGCRKIIISTNIAETSVTIPDVVCVIDCGRVREIRQDKRTNTRKLLVDWCSRASAKQRAGRAGRVQPGLCLKMYSSATERSVMKAAMEPEIKRMPLEEVCLNILAAGFSRSCVEFLDQTPQPPCSRAVQSAIKALEDVGAVSVVGNEQSRTGLVEVLTPLGRILAKLPVDCRLGKMLIFGSLLRCIDTVATIVASLSASQAIFVSSMKEEQKAKAIQASFYYPLSDFLTIVNVWKSFNELDGKTKQKRFCREHFLNYSALLEVRDGRLHFLDLLSGMGFFERIEIGYDSKKRMYDERVFARSSYNANGRNEQVVHTAICAGLYPNVAQLEANPSSTQGLWHEQERLCIHSSSVNSKLPSIIPSTWIAFHEKFGTASRVTISASCFVHPFALLLFGGCLRVLHTERKVEIDGWIEIPIAAKTGVLFVRLRKEVDDLLSSLIVSERKSSLDNPKISTLVRGLVDLLS